MRRAPSPAITAQMYRHFATMTVALTALIAFFANGEKQTAVAAERTAAQPAGLSTRPAPPPSEASDDTGGWGSDDPNAPVDKADAPSAPSEAEIAAATAASRLRSGAAGGD